MVPDVIFSGMRSREEEPSLKRDLPIFDNQVQKTVGIFGKMAKP